MTECGPVEQLPSRLAAVLRQGDEPEAAPAGRCMAALARNGNIPAAMLLAEVYRGGAVSGGAALQLDVFGRRIGWLHVAADQGDPPAQLLLAQETDDVSYRAMPDTTLAWYQAAAQNGSAPAMAAIADAYRQGRISEARLYGLKRWLTNQGLPGSADRRMLRLLTAPARSTPLPMPQPALRPPTPPQ